MKQDRIVDERVNKAGYSAEFVACYWAGAVHYGSEQLENETSNLTLSHELGSEGVSERANE